MICSRSFPNRRLTVPSVRQMAPKSRHRPPTGRGWEHLQRCRVARKVLYREAGHQGRARTHLHSRPSKRIGTSSSLWMTTHCHSTSRSMVPFTNTNSARKRQGQDQRYRPTYCGKVCIRSSSRRSQVQPEAVVRARSPLHEAVPPRHRCLRFLKMRHMPRSYACYGSFIS